MIAATVAQEQDGVILLQLQKEWDKLAPFPQQQNNLTTHHTTLCEEIVSSVREESHTVFYLRDECVSVNIILMHTVW